MPLARIASQPFFVPAVLIAFVAIPLAFEFIPPNRLYGFRTRNTLSDEEVWYRVNRVGGYGMVLASVVYLGAASLFPMEGAHDPRFSTWALHLAAFIGPVFLSVVIALLQ